MRKILFSILVFFPRLLFAQSVSANFNAADTVCINNPVTIQNTSLGASNYFWNFCTANINPPPTGTNLGNVGGLLSAPVYVDYVFTNGNYYGFVTNNYPGGLLRLDFGNSLLNTPVVTNLGNIGGAIPDNTEGVQIANDNGNWYVLVVGGDATNGTTPSLITVSLGANIANNAPIATNWGNIGNLSYPHDLYVFNDNGHWYGLTVNYSNSTITRFDLTTSLSNTPSATNLGNVGNLSGPTGIQAINDKGIWRVFVTNATSSTLTRLDFGASLLNIPAGVNLGNPNNAFTTCWDIYILKYCGENEAFVINANGAYDIVKLDFGASLLNTPTAASLGNQGGLNFPHCISKLFRVGADVFSFITNVNNNTLTLLQFSGCTNASIPNSTAQNPPGITYKKPGIYNINLTVDDGLPTQTSYCKQIVVQNCSKIINDYTEVLSFDICKNELTVTDASKYNPGDTVLIIQMKGADIDTTNTPNFGTITNYNSSGNYEFNIIKQKTGNVLALLNNLERTYDFLNGKVQLVRVPYYKNVNITSTLTCMPWDGSKGGVLAFNVMDTLTMNADIDVSGKGFRHGLPLNSRILTMNEKLYYYDPSTNKGAQKGEGIHTISISKNYGRGAPSNGGGGGNAHNCGGGGGGNGGMGGEGGDQWAGGDTLAENVGGKGGKSLVNSATLNKLYLGGSGGLGHANDLPEYPSGNGGGIIIFTAGSLTNNSNKILSNGANATEAPNIASCADGMPGGGGGGSILIDINQLNSPVSIEAKGGKGADHIAQNYLHGPGGGGGGGMIGISQSSTPPQYNFNLSGGINGVNVYHNNDPHGAMPGNAGILLNNFKPLVDRTIFKPNIDSVRITDSLYNCNNFNFNGLSFTQSFPINSWNWNFGDGNTSFSQNTSHTFATQGTYSVKLVVTDINGCKDSMVKPVTPSQITITKSPDTSLCGSSSANIFATGGSSYNWSPAMGLNDPNISNPVATPATTTNYYVTVSNMQGCKKIDSVKLTVNSFPVISKSSDTTVCINSPVPLSASGGSAYVWSPSSTLNNSNISNPIATPKDNTTYFVKVTNAAGCSKSDSIKVSTKPVPVITKSSDTTICNKISVKLFVTGGSSYLWSPSSSLDNPSSPTPVASPIATTIYQVAITDAQSCTYKDSVKISVRDKAIFSVSPDTSGCQKTKQYLTASGGTSYIWSPATFLDNPYISNPVASPDTSILYSVTIKENVCNESATLFTHITVLPLPNVQAHKSNDITCAFPSSHLNALGAQNYIWTPVESLNNATLPDPTATPIITTLYKVVGKGFNGCTNSDTVSVQVGFNKNILYGLPNSFTPNDDGINDCFGVKYWGQVNQLDFNIYNRFGERVFHTNNSSVCWDGKYKGQPQDPGAFVYIIKAKTACGIIDKKGTVILLR